MTKLTSKLINYLVGVFLLLQGDNLDLVLLHPWLLLAPPGGYVLSVLLISIDSAVNGTGGTICIFSTTSVFCLGGFFFSIYLSLFFSLLPAPPPPPLPLPLPLALLLPLSSFSPDCAARVATLETRKSSHALGLLGENS